MMNETTKKNKNKIINPLHKKFVAGYIENGGNATQAVIDAGYNVKDRQVASTVGHQLLKRENLQEAIQRSLDELDINPNWLNCQVKQLAVGSERDETRLNALKFLYTLAGHSQKGASDKTINKNNFNIRIDKGVVPVNLLTKEQVNDEGGMSPVPNSPA